MLKLKQNRLWAMLSLMLAFTACSTDDLLEEGEGNGNGGVQAEVTLSIKQNPDNYDERYDFGADIDLTGLVISMTIGDQEPVDIEEADFVAEGISYDKMVADFAPLMNIVFTRAATETEKEASVTLSEVAVKPEGVVTDRDGNDYQTVTLGEQVWMAENLRNLLKGTENELEIRTGQGIWVSSEASVMQSNPDDLQATPSLLYNYQAAMLDGLCPEGFRIPSPEDFQELTDFIAAEVDEHVGRALASNSDWSASTVSNSPGEDLSKNNASGFNALPVGLSSEGGMIPASISSQAYFMTNSINSFNRVDCFEVRATETMPLFSDPMGLGQDQDSNGLSIRCVREK
ncbi:fibrobacter succinogenes major paralogous domain-containing protein [Flammeovirga aprica]|uniref:Fibrobacter succinogenes major paralogous domain-containing protein n=1 Tax=Flammeovirga aprica JL-4 TaxID=694437 RepID=A0A7X9P2M8_9BACT|nr:fibrobacter succinogenes major paralogous domain-containing protein [Flammeovirga aprica]NME67529.1 hypothetical protein [Flammeovirga aprica JL-4]